MPSVKHVAISCCGRTAVDSCLAKKSPFYSLPSNLKFVVLISRKLLAAAAHHPLSLVCFTLSAWWCSPNFRADNYGCGKHLCRHNSGPAGGRIGERELTDSDHRT